MEHGVVDGQDMVGTGPDQEDTITVSFSNSVFSDGSALGLVVFADAGVEVTKKGELFQLWDSEDEAFQFFIEHLLGFLGIGHGRSVGAHKSSGYLLAEEKLEFHEAYHNGFPAHQGYQGNQGKLFYFFPVREKSGNLKKMPQIREKPGNFDWPKNRK